MYYPPPSTTEECVSRIDSRLTALINNANINDFDITFTEGSSFSACFYCRKAEGVNNPHRVIGWKPSSSSGSWILGYDQGRNPSRQVASGVSLATWQWLYSLMDLVENYTNYYFVPANS